ncbi:MAG: CBS domain-containing protein, partial [Spirochaetes bacterium]|nr:CBS domain-containing protein [Spirochaetota bacterium]
SLNLDSGRTMTERELDIAVKLGQDAGLIDESEKMFIDNVLRFSKKEAMNVMIPRNRALFIPSDTDADTAMEIFIKSGAVRAPVIKDKPDNVVGILDSRDLLPFVMGYKRAKNINLLLHDVHHYPASRELGDLLNDFLEKKIQMAIVVDEYGGTAGVVSLKSILSELMGREFIDPVIGRRDDSDIRAAEAERIVISGDMQIVDYNYKFNDSIESSESETIGGYIIEKLGRIPKRTEILETERNILTVKHKKKNRIESIELKKKQREIE